MLGFSLSIRCSIAIAVLQVAGGVSAFGQAAPASVPPGVIPPKVPETPGLRVFDPSLVDKTVDPCENFYRYSCNNWFKRNPLPADQVAYGRFTELDELNRLAPERNFGSGGGARAYAIAKRAEDWRRIRELHGYSDREQAGINTAEAGARSHCRSHSRRSCRR